MTSPNVRLGSVRLTPGAPYYRDDLALVHHLGFGFHADMCAPGILRLPPGVSLVSVDLTVQLEQLAFLVQLGGSD